VRKQRYRAGARSPLPIFTCSAVLPRCTVAGVSEAVLAANTDAAAGAIAATYVDSTPRTVVAVCDELELIAPLEPKRIASHVLNASSGDKESGARCQLTKRDLGLYFGGEARVDEYMVSEKYPVGHRSLQVTERS
jgi:hypothetical protein